MARDAWRRGRGLVAGAASFQSASCAVARVRVVRGMGFTMTYLVVHDHRFALEQKRVVLGVVPRALMVIAREALDRVDRLPERQRDDVRDFPFAALEVVDAAI